MTRKWSQKKRGPETLFSFSRHETKGCACGLSPKLCGPAKRGKGANEGSWKEKIESSSMLHRGAELQQ